MEIEERAFIDSFSEVEQKLQELGFTEKHQVEIADHYFCREEDSTVEDIAMDEPGSYGLRIRKIGDEIELNCKVIRWDGDHNAFQEHETEVDSLEETRNILKAIGFKNFCTLKKTRTIYESEDGIVEVNLEDFPDFSDVIEIEIVTDNQIDQARERISTLLDKLGVTEENRIDKSITLLYFHENAFQQA